MRALSSNVSISWRHPENPQFVPATRFHTKPIVQSDVTGSVGSCERHSAWKALPFARRCCITGFRQIWFFYFGQRAKCMSNASPSSPSVPKSPVSAAGSGNASKSTFARDAAVFLVRLYQMLIAPFLPPNTCRFSPTCSQYAIDALKKYGVLSGSWRALKRIGRCHPFHPGGYDPA